jgi:hypothetical protein
MLKPAIFKDFSEYWYFVRRLSDNQRQLVFEGLSSEQKRYVEDSYRKEGWADVLARNEIDALLDKLKDKYGYDVLDIRAKALKGKSVYAPARFWDLLESHLRQYQSSSVSFVLSGLKTIPCKENEQVVLVVSSDLYPDE